MDEFEDSYKNAVEAGQRNLKATKLLSNWCFHAEFVRSPGRGMIEAATGLPIGHMGVQCKFSKKNSMYCWLLEDAVYDFYQNNCKGCKERVPVGFPNILDFVGPREKAAEKRKSAREEEERGRKQKQFDRRQERAKLRYELSLGETFVFDLLDELDQENIASDDPRLEQLANLAPETFTRRVIEHLLPAVLNEYLPYSKHAAKALLRAPLEPEEKLLVGVRLISNYEKSSAAIDVVLSHAEKLSRSDLTKVLHRFVSMAIGPPPTMHFGGSTQTSLDAAPIHSLFEKMQVEICAEVDELLSDSDPNNIGAAVEIILATDSDELLLRHARSIFAKLMRRKTLLPGERRDSSVLYYLREAASKCLGRFPEETDKIIQSFLADNNDTGRKEAHGTYDSVLNHRYREKVQIGTAQRIAFRRLLWAAVERPDSMDDAGQFFRHSWDEFAQLAVEHFDDLIGAAATLSEKYDQVDAKHPLVLADNVLDHMERSNKRTAINSLQGALIEWAAVGAKSKGPEGIGQFLELYRKLPDAQTQMRGNMIAHVSKLLTGVESLKLVLSDWYRALMDESTLVRASAVQAWEDVPYDLVKNFPDLFFEAFSVLLMDPYVMVHKSAVHSLRRRSFPEEKRSVIKHGLWNLIVYYSQESKQEDFVVDCIDAFAFLCLSPEERKGKLGELLSGILFCLEGSALYRAVDRLHYGFKTVPGFVKVALKSIQDDYTRSISIDDCASAILSAPHNELQYCVGDIRKAFEALRPFKPEDFVEALLYAAALTKAGNHAAANTCFRELMASIPAEDRNEHWRIEAALVATASEIERAIENGEDFVELIEEWSSLLNELEKENEERAKLRDFPSGFFFED
ncbi:hypothetical protein [Geomobilimonas luticola]|uniref:Uncharacterized protein n=1 Tax=Geomobilimonas luticola TaxID=1114878 RepID=A0ABS5SAK7_9BACT|nr:hypothetical protein [Geomobilimonas luticola]MBT0651539.1 hypothetical protein [Geomobilimonas luticola]